MRSIAPPFDRLVGTRLPRRTTPKPCRRLANEVERQPARAVRELPHVHLASHPGIPAGAADDRIDVRAVRRAVDRDRAAVPQEERAVARLRVDAQAALDAVAADDARLGPVPDPLLEHEGIPGRLAGGADVHEG